MLSILISCGHQFGLMAVPQKRASNIIFPLIAAINSNAANFWFYRVPLGLGNRYCRESGRKRPSKWRWRD